LAPSGVQLQELGGHLFAERARPRGIVANRLGVRVQQCAFGLGEPFLPEQRHPQLPIGDGADARLVGRPTAATALAQERFGIRERAHHVQAGAESREVEIAGVGRRLGGSGNPNPVQQSRSSFLERARTREAARQCAHRRPRQPPLRTPRAEQVRKRALVAGGSFGKPFSAGVPVAQVVRRDCGLAVLGAECPGQALEPAAVEPLALRPLTPKTQTPGEVAHGRERVRVGVAEYLESLGEHGSVPDDGSVEIALSVRAVSETGKGGQCVRVVRAEDRDPERVNLLIHRTRLRRASGDAEEFGETVPRLKGERVFGSEHLLPLLAGAVKQRRGPFGVPQLAVHRSQVEHRRKGELVPTPERALRGVERFALQRQRPAMVPFVAQGARQTVQPPHQFRRYRLRATAVFGEQRPEEFFGAPSVARAAERAREAVPRVRPIRVSGREVGRAERDRPFELRHGFSCPPDVEVRVPEDQSDFRFGQRVPRGSAVQILRDPVE
jgi:hypothetical protein